MARYPKAKWRPVAGLENDPVIRPIGIIFHVDGMNASSLFDWFNGPSGGIESHMHLNNALDWEQFRDTTRNADANYKGNYWMENGEGLGYISVETQGYAEGEWTVGVLRELVEFSRWAADIHGFPLERAKTYRSPGLGYHVMFGAGVGLNAWSNSRGKVCPGPKRIAQFENVLLPTLRNGIMAGEPFNDKDREWFSEKNQLLVNYLRAIQGQTQAITGAVAAMAAGEKFDEQKFLDGVRTATAQGILDAGIALQELDKPNE